MKRSVMKLLSLLLVGTMLLPCLTALGEAVDISPEADITILSEGDV